MCEVPPGRNFRVHPSRFARRANNEFTTEYTESTEERNLKRRDEEVPRKGLGVLSGLLGRGLGGSGLVPEMEIF